MDRSSKSFSVRDTDSITIKPTMASTVQQSAMSGGEIVLGLLVERPDTCYQLDKRLAELLGSAQFSRGTAARAVRRLLERELIRPAHTERPERLSVVDGRRKTVYEPTPSGVEHFRRWLRASTQTPPVREELHAKIALWGAEDLPRLIEIVREAELACVQRLQELNRRARSHAQVAMDEWEHIKRLIVVSAEVSWWDARIKWLQDIRQYLEREGARRARTGGGLGALTIADRQRTPPRP
jgi:DNA-binding PadR family transcriptional regulator